MAILQVSFLVVWKCILFTTCVGTYTLIHAFLVKHAHLKAAQALKNSVKNGLILKDNAIPKGPSLEDIIRLWKARLQDEGQK